MKQIVVLQYQQKITKFINAFNSILIPKTIKMKNLILPFGLLLLLSCKIDHSKPESNLAQIQDSVYNIQSVYGPNLPSNPYELKLDMHQLDNTTYDLEIQVLLNHNSYFVSPNAKRDFKGKFTFFVNTTNSFTLKNKLIETPLSKEEYDSHPFVDGLVNWVRVNTSYKQKLEITTTEDFVVGGFIQVKPDEVVVLADFAEHVADMSDDEISQAKDRAEKAMSEKEKLSAEDFEHFATQLERSLTRERIRSKWRGKKYRDPMANK